MSAPDRQLLSAVPLAWPTVALSLGCLAVLTTVGLLAGTGRLPAGPAVLLQTVCIFASFTPMHDATHHGVSRTEWLNETVGWLSSFPLLVPFPAFRHIHLTHHKHTNHPTLDPDMWSGRGPAWLRPLRWLTQDGHYYRHYVGTGRPRKEKALVALSMMVGGALMVFFCATGHGLDLLLFWVLPARLAICLLAFAFDYLPHRPHQVLAADDRFRATSVFENRALVPILLWQNYHLVHHLYPAVPFYRYGVVWWGMRDELIAKGAQVRKIFR